MQERIAGKWRTLGSSHIGMTPMGHEYQEQKDINGSTVTVRAIGSSEVVGAIVGRRDAIWEAIERSWRKPLPEAPVMSVREAIARYQPMAESRYELRKAEGPGDLWQVWIVGATGPKFTGTKYECEVARFGYIGAFMQGAYHGERGEVSP